MRETGRSAGRPVPQRSHHRRNHAVIPAESFVEPPVSDDRFGPIVKELLHALQGQKTFAQRPLLTFLGARLGTKIACLGCQSCLKSLIVTPEVLKDVD